MYNPPDHYFAPRRLIPMCDEARLAKAMEESSHASNAAFRRLNGQTERKTPKNGPAIARTGMRQEVRDLIALGRIGTFEILAALSKHNPKRVRETITNLAANGEIQNVAKPGGVGIWEAVE